MRANVEMATAAEMCNVPCFNEALVRKLKRAMPGEEELADAVSLFAALNDRARLKILYALRDGDELCVCDFAHILGITVSTASHHLRKLRDLRILKYRNDGKMAYYSLRDSVAGQIVTEMLDRIGV